MAKKPKQLPNPLEFLENKVDEYDKANWIIYAIIILIIILVYVIFKVLT